MRNGGMDRETFSLFLEQLRRFVRGTLVPAERDVIENDRVPDRILAQMRELGLFGITTPVEFGGAGMNISQYIETVMELCWAAPAYRSLLGINVGIVTSALTAVGTDAQKRDWLPRLAAGEIASFGLTEPDSGSDSANMRTRAVREGDSYVLNGVKRYITNAPFASVALIMARTNAENLPKNRHVSGFIVPLNSPGVKIGKSDKKLGQAGAQIADIVMEDVRVPASALLGGEEGTGFRAAMQALDTGRIAIGAVATGYASRVLSSGLRYATERKAFGEPIGNFQLIQAMLADSKAEIYASQCMLRDVAARADRGEKVSLEASCVKMFASEMCGRVADRVVQIHGGAGYLAEYEAERFYRDVRVYRIYEGTTQIQQLVIAKHMLRAFSADASC